MMTQNRGLTPASNSSSGMSNQMIMPDIAKMQSIIIGGSLLSHIDYCDVLVSVLTVLIMKASGTAVSENGITTK
jgi:hypothetical protein